MLRYFSEMISGNDLEEMIYNHRNHHDIYDVCPDDAQVHKDLCKVDFDWENSEFGEDDLLGTHTLPNGLTYIGGLAARDWEYPVFFIIYWDGKKLRGYVPKEGNIWNTDTNQAYGNDEYSDAPNINKRRLASPSVTYRNWDGPALQFDSGLILQDIMQRIQRR